MHPMDRRVRLLKVKFAPAAQVKYALSGNNRDYHFVILKKIKPPPKRAASFFITVLFKQGFGISFCFFKPFFRHGA